MLYSFLRLVIAAVSVVFASVFTPKHKSMKISYLSYAWRALVISYRFAEQMAFDAYGVTSDIFAKYYAKVLRIDRHSRPLDAYYLIMEELTITHDLDPEIWN